MAFIRLFENPNVTQEQYDAASEAVGVTSDNMPEGAVLHAAGAGPNGAWRVLEIWEDEGAAKRFDEEKVEPVLRSVGIERPEPQTWQIHNLVVKGG